MFTSAANEVTQYAKTGGYLCIADSIGRGMGTSGDYSGKNPKEMPSIDDSLADLNLGILGRLFQTQIDSRIASEIKNMNLPASLDFTKKYVSGSYAAMVADAVGCSKGKSDWKTKNTDYWPLCYVGETTFGVNDLLNFDDGITDNDFTHGACDIYSMFLYPFFGTNQSYSRGVSSNLLTDYLKRNYRQNSGYETSASLISIELGLNDVIVKAMTDSKICADPMQKFLDVNDFNKNQSKYKGYLPAYSKALIDNEEKWEKSYEVLLKGLQGKNNKADYILVGLYDPFEGVSVPSGFEVLNTDTAAIVVKMNAFVKSMAAKYGCMYVDISDTETLNDAKGYDLITAGTSADCTIEYGFHPSQEGHKAIGNKIIEKLKTGDIEEGEGGDIEIEDDTKDASYTVKHYKQNLDGTYSENPDDTESGKGKSGDELTPKVKSYEGFTAPATQTVTLSAEGETA